MIIRSIDDYNLAVRRLERHPLLSAWDDVEEMVYMPIHLRVEIQHEEFGKYSNSLQRFYRWCWDNIQQRCEETMTPLWRYSAVHISHILTRGAHPEKALDPRNINLLTLQEHTRWEVGNRSDMRIYLRNERTIFRLNREYRQLQPVNLK